MSKKSSLLLFLFCCANPRARAFKFTPGRCETLEPPSAYDARNLLAVPSRDDSPTHIARKLQEKRESGPAMVEALAHDDTDSDLKAAEEFDKELEKEEEEEEEEESGGGGGSEDVQGTVSFFSKASRRPYSDGLVRGDLCVFIPARAEEIARWEVAVVSILQFVPGVRVAIAAEEDALDAYKRYGKAKTGFEERRKPVIIRRRSWNSFLS